MKLVPLVRRFEILFARICRELEVCITCRTAAHTNLLSICSFIRYRRVCFANVKLLCLLVSFRFGVVRDAVCRFVLGVSRSNLNEFKTFRRQAGNEIEQHEYVKPCSSTKSNILFQKFEFKYRLTQEMVVRTFIAGEHTEHTHFTFLKICVNSLSRVRMLLESFQKEMAYLCRILSVAEEVRRDN